MHGKFDRVVLDDSRDAHAAEASTRAAPGKARALP
jgi:hypothetical protein